MKALNTPPPPFKSFKNKVVSNILQSYCSLVFFFSFFIFVPFIYLLIPCFFLALVSTYLLCLNII